MTRVYRFPEPDQALKFKYAKSQNDGNSTDSDAENEALFIKKEEPLAIPQVIKEEEEKMEEKMEERMEERMEEKMEIKEEQKTLRRTFKELESEEVLLSSDDSGEEPQEYELIIGQFDEVDRVRQHKIGRRYRCKLLKVILRLAGRDYIAAKVTADILY